MKPQRKKELMQIDEQAGGSLAATVDELIKNYRAQNGTENEVVPRVIPHGQRAGAYDIAEVHEDANLLLHQLTQSKIEREHEEQERIEIDSEPPLLVLARQVRTFTTYFCGLKKERPVWCYQESLAARLDFAQAEKMVARLGEGVFAMPALERRAVANRRSW